MFFSWYSLTSELGTEFARVGCSWFVGYSPWLRRSSAVPPASPPRGTNRTLSPSLSIFLNLLELAHRTSITLTYLPQIANAKQGISQWRQLRFNQWRAANQKEFSHLCSRSSNCQIAIIPGNILNSSTVPRGLRNIYIGVFGWIFLLWSMHKVLRLLGSKSVL